jgi:hypothetical protein
MSLSDRGVDQMPSVTCPSCGEKGKITPQFIGARIKCLKCGVSFVVASSTPRPATEPAAVEEHHEGIKVEGLENPTAWESEAEPRTITSDATAEPAGNAAAAREYRLLTQKDRFFDGRFDLVRLEEALNHYARSGWVVRSMVSAPIKGYSGTAQEEIVVLLEREAG